MTKRNWDRVRDEKQIHRPSKPLEPAEPLPPRRPRPTCPVCDQVVGKKKSVVVEGRRLHRKCVVASQSSGHATPRSPSAGPAPITPNSNTPVSRRNSAQDTHSTALPSLIALVKEAVGLVDEIRQLTYDAETAAPAQLQPDLGRIGDELDRLSAWLTEKVDEVAQRPSK